MFIARQLEILLFGEYRKRIPVRIMTDSESTLESITSTNRKERTKNDSARNEREVDGRRNKILSVAFYKRYVG